MIFYLRSSMVLTFSIAPYPVGACHPTKCDVKIMSNYFKQYITGHTHKNLFHYVHVTLQKQIN